MTTETTLRDRLHAAADRIVVDPDLGLVLDRTAHPPRSGGSRCVHATTAAPRTGGWAVAGVVAAALAATGVAVAVGDPFAGQGPPAATVPVSPAGQGTAFLPQVADAPAWFGEPRSAVRQTGDRTGRWVALALGRTDDGDGDPATVVDPIVVAAFDGGWRPLEGATPTTVDGLPALSIERGGWGALAVVFEPVTGEVIQLVIGANHTLRAGLLPGITVQRPSGELTLAVDELPAGYRQVVTPRVLGPDPASRPTLTDRSGRTVLDDVSDLGDPLLAAAMTGSDLTAVDVHGRTGWVGRSTIDDTELRFLAWSPRPGVVFEITTDDPERTVDDLVELARATTPLPADEWHATYG